MLAPRACCTQEEREDGLFRVLFEAGNGVPGIRTGECCAALAEGQTVIMRTMNWQKHTVRGFVAGAMKKAGYAVESFKSDGGERT